jgi:outer membrane protein assembly factor BamE (lipoprotein component of BamABCDE complex)
MLASLALLPLTTACVTENTTTGEMIPRGNQRYPWDRVKELEKQLKDGMTKSQVMYLMGSPAETNKEGDEWVYLPERYGILIPAEALHLKFEGATLVKHGYRPIILGAQL